MNKSISPSVLALAFTVLACSGSDGNPAKGQASGGGTSTISSAGGSHAGTSSNGTSVGGAVAGGAGGGGSRGGTRAFDSSSSNLGGTPAGTSNGTSAPITTGGTPSGGASSSSSVVGTSAGGASSASSVGGTSAGGTSSASNVGGANAKGGQSSTGGGSNVNLAGATSTSTAGAPNGSPAAFPFPQNVHGQYCVHPTSVDNERVRAGYAAWYQATVTSDGAGGFLRIKKPDSGSVIGSTVSEGIGYGMLLAVYMNDQHLFDQLFKYEQSHVNAHGLMDWEIGPDNQITSGGHGAATDGDEDIAWSLIMADRQWGGGGTLADSYLNFAKRLIDAIWTYEVDQERGYLLKPGDAWGNVDVTNPSYFAPAYFRVFGQVSGKTEEWKQVIAGNYDILERSLNAASGNQDNGLVPAWCDSTGKPVVAYSGAPTHFQNDSTRTPFRVGQDYCYFGDPRAKSYLSKISQFYVKIGVAGIVDGYNLDGTPRPERAVNGAQAASFVGPAAVGAMSDGQYQSFVDAGYAAVATLGLNAGTIYYQKSWTALSLLMLTGNFIDFTQLAP
ncbi:MAG TPA: glycosyl hydrolase family 8 [Polyangiaceae bacterium]